MNARLLLGATALVGIYYLSTREQLPSTGIVNDNGTIRYTRQQASQLDRVTENMSNMGLYDTARINASGQLVGGF